MASTTINIQDYTNNGQYPAPSGQGVWNLIDSDGAYLPSYTGDYDDLLANLTPDSYTLCPSSYTI